MLTITIIYLTLKVPITTAADDNFFFFYFSEETSLDFADDSHDMSRLVFSEK